MKKLKVGIIGCGFIANGKHLPSMARLEDVEVVAFCDLIIERAQASAKKYGAPDALVCLDYQDVLARPDIDVVHVCTPNNSHAEITVAALQAGKHVMCEKPMAKTAAEARAMLEAARATGKKLTIGYQNRFREDSLFMKSLCESGDLGEIYFAKAFATRRRGVPTWGVFMDKEKQGGGPLIDLATHALDLTLWMMQNYEPETVLGSTFDKIGKRGSPANSMGPWDPAQYEVEDKAGADMFPPSGPIVRTSDFQSAASYHVRVNGERNGKLFVQNYAMGASFIGDGSQAENLAGGYKEMEAWFNSVREEAELVVKPEQAYTVTRILEAIYQSAASGDVVYMSES
jgi:predicted dehydrogenase